MLSEKRESLQPLLESSDGIHLTGYLVNRGNLADLRSQLQGVLRESEKFLKPVMSPEVIGRFLEPVESLCRDRSILERMNGNIGIFRTPNSFRVLNIPVHVEPSCVVATTFHVKPLLRWIQMDREFLLLVLDEDSAHLYLGNLQTLVEVDAILFPAFQGVKGYRSLQRRDDPDARLTETLQWLEEILTERSLGTKPMLFVAGASTLLDPLVKNLPYPDSLKFTIPTGHGPASLSALASVARNEVKYEVSRKLELDLIEFRLAEDMNLTRKNIFQIAKAAAQGRVKKLIIADGVKIFGRMDPKSGGLAIHPCDLDHEDDDLLDDLAQTVLLQGGEVVVADSTDIPNNRPILAILKSQDSHLFDIRMGRRDWIVYGKTGSF